MIGGAIGASLCFFIARHWGRRAYEHFLPEKLVREIDQVARRLAKRALVITRLLPVMGADIVSYAAGLTPIRYRDYLVITIVFSLPSVILVSVIGGNVREDRTVAAVGLGILAAFFLIPLGYYSLRKRPSRTPVAADRSLEGPGTEAVPIAPPEAG